VNALDDLLGRSPAMVAVRERVARFLAGQSAARRTPPILIEGETGTGKGLLAQLIQRTGPRRAGPFVEVNCAAIPDTLIEAELFGFERGAFTDARQAKPGLFQAAHQGTIFLDEVGLLPDAAQAKLLKVLEEREVRRLGATRSEPADVAIISATNEPLARAVQERRLRQDLYHRLAVLTIDLPPLRERGEDILALAEHFLGRVTADYGLGRRTFSVQARAALTSYSWPGNVRQLANVVERAALLSESATIPVDALELRAGPGETPREPPVTTRPEPPSEAAPAESSTVERDRLLDVLTANGWNVSRAATQLGLSRNTIRYRIEKHGLRPGMRPVGSPVTPAARVPAPDVEVARAAPAASPRSSPAPAGVIRWQRRRIALLRADVRSPLSMEDGRVLSALVDKAHLFGGRVEDLGTSGVWVVFGVDPVEDAPRRAANAALAMRRALEQVGAHTAFGVHVAELDIASVAGEDRLERDAKEAAFGTIERLVRESPDGAIVVCATAARFLERRFELEPVDEGGSGMRLVTPDVTGFRLSGRLTAFVDRDEELDVLRHRFAAAAGGLGQLVGIVADAGMGKSRLVFEFRRRLGADTATYLEGRCMSYGKSIPYLPLVDIVRAAAGVGDVDSPDVAIEKLAAMVAEVGLDADEATAYLASLLGFKHDTARIEHLSPEALQTRVFETLRHWLFRQRRRPLVLVVEDLHWIDRSSEDFLDSIVDAVPTAPILLIITSRPGHRPPWADRTPVTQIALPPLPAADQPRVVQSVLGTRQLPPSALDAVIRRAEGNPFFLEELTRAIDDRGVWDPAAVPATIEEVLRARMALLPGETRRLLEIASVLGREIPLRFLHDLWDGEEPPETHLRTLARSGFVYEAGGLSETTYVFKHALTAEVAYASLPPERRTALHAAAGLLVERLYVDRLEEVYDRLAHHFSRARDHVKGVLYLTRFADRAARSYAHAAAVDALATARGLAAELAPGPARNRSLIDLTLREAHSLHFLGRFNAAYDVLRAHAPIVEDVADLRIAGPFHFWLARTQSVLGEREATHANVMRALELAEQAADAATYGKASFLLAFEDYWSGRLADGITHARQAVQSLEGTDDRWWLGMSHWILALNAVLASDFEVARDAAAAAESIGRAMDDARLVTYAAWTAGWVATCTGDAARALEACRRSLEHSRDPVNTAYALGQYGHAHLEAGDAKRAIELLDDAIRRLAAFHPGFRQTTSRFLALLAEAHLATGSLDAADLAAREALDTATTVAFAYAVGLARRAIGNIAHARGDVTTATVELDGALETFAGIGARLEASRTRLALADVAASAGERERAQEHLDEARRMLAVVGVTAEDARTRAVAARLGA
jgi:DNA-binding NtrC family response regulator/tetratricopeptide (TPR) repeat protein